MNHAELVAAIQAEAKTRGLWCWPTPPSTPLMVAGWPDLVILGHPGSLFVECKSEDGRRTREQIRVAQRLLEAGLSYRLWRPSDLESGVIAAALEAIA